MEYKGYKIRQDYTGYAPENMQFHFYIYEGEVVTGYGKSIEDCKERIEELILNN